MKMSEQEKELHVKVDSTQIRKDLSEEITEKVQLQERVKQLEAEAEQAKEYKEFFDKNSGKGSLPSSLNKGEGGSGNNPETSKEYDSFPELVDDIRQNDPEKYKLLFEKGIQALRENPRSFEYRDPFLNGESCVAKTLRKMNEKARGKR